MSDKKDGVVDQVAENRPVVEEVKAEEVKSSVRNDQEYKHRILIGMNMI
jgi:hypothetical protein